MAWAPAKLYSPIIWRRCSSIGSGSRAASESAASRLPLGFGPRRGRNARRQSLLLGHAAEERHALRVLRYNRRGTCVRSTALKSAKETENEKRLQGIRHRYACVAGG